MKFRKWLYALRLAVITMLVALIGATAIACKKKDNKKYPENGVYICYDVSDECALTLNKGKFTYVVDGEAKNGSYKITDVAIELTFSDKTQVGGAYGETWISFEMDDYRMNFYKVVDFTVTYETNGGSAIESATVINGQTVKTAPTAPTRNGYTFIGWYTDTACKTPYYFGTQKVTGDTTLYAYWVVTPEAQAEFEISFDLNYAGATNPASVTTIGGKLYNANVPSPVRSGYTFKGWAISNFDDSDKLSYDFVDGMEFFEDTTLVAVWESNQASGGKLATPIVSVESSAIKWSAVSGVSSYKVEVIAPDGTVITTDTTGSTSYNYDFSALDAGSYTVRVTAIASDVTKNSDAGVRYYNNKVLARVSHYTVEGTVISFTGVENATEYFVSIACGDPYHNHVMKSIGDATSYDFKNCIMSETGISFCISAAADGYSTSHSRIFNYKKVLSAVTGVAVDETTGVVTWNAVPNATEYVVTVSCGNPMHADEKAYVTEESYSVKCCDKKDGGIVISISAMAEGYGTSPASSFVYDRTTLATPSFVKIDGTTMSWTSVAGATGYEIKIGDTTVTATTNSKDIADAISWAAANAYTVQIRATASGAASAWSDEIDARYLAMASSIKYEKGIVSWAHVVGSTAYQVKVNEGEAITVEDGSNFAEVALTQAGENTISVCYTDGTTTSDWVSVKVTAYAVEFDTLVATTTYPTQYKAQGDPTDFDGSSLEKTGYTFVAWYYGAGGGATCEKQYVDGYFKGTADIKLYAYYTPNTYKATYDYQGGDAWEETEQDIVFDSAFTMPTPTITADATKGFDGWYTAPNGMGIRLTDEFGVSVKGGWTVAEDCTVYAFYRDMILDYTLTKLPGYQGDVYAVSKGGRIAMVSEVSIPETFKGLPVKIILPSAFKDVRTLKSLRVPDTMELIYTQPSAFTGCSNLSSIEVYEAGNEGTLRYWSEDGVLFDNGSATDVTKKVSIAWFPLTKSGSYVIPSGVQVIPSFLFDGTSLTEIVIPTTVEAIKRDAFYNCTALTSIVFEKADEVASVSTPALKIERFAFRSCTNLVEVNLPARLTSIELSKYELSDYSESAPSYKSVLTGNTAEGVTDAFYSCSKLAKITVNSNNEAYSCVNNIVMNKAQTEVIYVPKYYKGELEIPSGVKTIGDGALAMCYYITKLIIPNTVEFIGECGVYNCYNMTDVVFKGNGFNDLEFGVYAFRSCYAIKNFTFESSAQITARRLTKIGEGAFYDCDFRSFVIPATVTEIADQAFRGNYYMKTITFTPNTAEDATLTFGSYVFYDTEIERIDFPVHVSDLGGVFSGLELQGISIPEENKYYQTDAEGVLFNKAMTEILYYPLGRIGNYTIPSSVTKIGDGVFFGNYNMTEITIPASVTSIGNAAFSGAKALRTVIFENGDGSVPLTLGDRVFYECPSIVSLTLPARTVSYGAYCFAYMDGLQTLVLNEGLTEIPGYSIYQSHKLKSLAIPSTVERIAYYGLAYAYGLKTVTFTKNTEGKTAIKEFAQYAFYYSHELESITIPASVETIGYYSFYSSSSGTTMTSLREVKFEPNSNLKTIMPYAFYYTKVLETIEIPKSVEQIGYYAFYYSGVSTVTFEKGGTENLVVGGPMEYKTSPTSSTSYAYGYAFYYCTNLHTVHFPARLKELGRYAFRYSGITTVSFMDLEGDSMLEQIGEYAFYETDITSVDIPNTIGNKGYVNVNPNYPDPESSSASSYWFNRQALGRYAFGYCYELETVNFEEGGTKPMSLGRGAFYNCEKLQKIDLPARLVSYEGYEMDYGPFADTNKFAGCLSLKEINIVGEPIPENELVSVDGIVYNKDKTEVFLCPMGREKKVTIPSTVTKIGKEAFANCYKITQVEFEAVPQGQTLTIGESAFSNCTAIQSFTIAKHVTSIEPYAFEGCTALEELVLPDQLGAFDASAFRGCTSLKDISISNNKSYVVSDGVLYDPAKTTIYYYPNSKADKVFTIPSTVTGIHNSAFYGNNSLEEVVLQNGKLAEIKDYAFYECSALKKVTIGNTVAKIGDYAFYNCASLEDVIFQEGGSTPLEIGNRDFVGKTDTYTNSTTRVEAFYPGFVFAYNYRLSEFVIPERTVSIADSTFYSCRGLVEIVIPANVEEIGAYAFYDCERLASVEFAEGTKLTGIHAYTFAYCYSLPEITIPASIERFEHRFYQGKDKVDESYAFYYCENLKNVYFEEGSKLETIPKYLFGYCYALEEIEIPEKVSKIVTGGSSSYSPFYHCESLHTITFAGKEITEFEAYTFAYCYALENIEIPDTIVKLGNYLFYYCVSLEEFVIPETVGEIGNYLFYYCASLTDVTLPETMTSIPNGMFYYCTSLTEVEFPENVSDFGSSIFGMSGIRSFTIPEWMTEVPDYFFSGASNMEEVVLHDKITYIGEDAFYDTAIEELVIPDSVTEIGYYAFEYMPNLRRVVLPNNSSFTTIPESLCSGCSVLEEVVIPASVTSIEYYAFDNTGLKEIVIPDTVTSIAEGAFSYCQNLKSVTLPSALTSIPGYMFSSCVELETVVLPQNLIEIEYYAFDGCEKLSFELPESVIVLGECALRNTAISKIHFGENFSVVGDSALSGCVIEEMTVDAANKAFKLEGGILYDFDKTTIYASTAAVEHEEFTIPTDVTIKEGALSGLNAKKVIFPEGTTSIPQYFFQNAKNIKEVVLPSGLETINMYAFRNSGLTKINIPNTVTNISSYAFENSEISDITFEKGGTKALVLGSYLFRKCENITSFTVPYRVRTTSTTSPISYTFQDNESLEEVFFEEDPEEGAIEGVLTIGYSTFKGTSLRSVHFPKALSHPNTTSTSYYAIGGNAFENCKLLETVTFAEGFNNPVSFGYKAFMGCEKLKNFDFPETTVSIGYQVLAGTAVEEITIPESVAYYGESSVYKYYYPEEQRISLGYEYYSRPFDGCLNLKKVTIKSNLELGPHFFYNCPALTTVIIEADEFEGLGDSAFAGCTGIKELVVPKATTVGKNAFEGWTSGQKITLGNSPIETYEWNVFWQRGCSANIVFAN